MTGSAPVPAGQLPLATTHRSVILFCSTLQTLGLAPFASTILAPKISLSLFASCVIDTCTRSNTLRFTLLCAMLNRPLCAALRSQMPTRCRVVVHGASGLVESLVVKTPAAFSGSASGQTGARLSTYFIRKWACWPRSNQTDHWSQTGPLCAEGTVKRMWDSGRWPTSQHPSSGAISPLSSEPGRPTEMWL